MSEQLNSTRCRSCGKEILMLKHGRTLKINPVEAAAHADGNLVISRTRQLYRMATAEEKQTARATGKNLYISHFATCEQAKTFRKT